MFMFVAAESSVRSLLQGQVLGCVLIACQYLQLQSFAEAFLQALLCLPSEGSASCVQTCRVQDQQQQLMKMVPCSASTPSQQEQECSL